MSIEALRTSNTIDGRSHNDETTIKAFHLFPRRDGVKQAYICTKESRLDQLARTAM